MSNIIEIGGGASGGSNVVANPIEAASDTLTKIGIDGTVYDISGGGGSGYSETTLWSGSETPSISGTQINLTDNISNYDEIVFVMDTDYVGSNSFLVSQLTIGNTYIATIYAPSNYGAYWTYNSDTQITIKSQASASPKTYTKVIGIKYGGASGHNYSTTEHIVGTWIDGSTIYEKTFVLPSQVSTVANTWSTITGLTLSGNEDIIVRTEIYLANDKSCKVGFGKNDNGVFKYFDTIALLINQVTIRYTKTSA